MTQNPPTPDKDSRFDSATGQSIHTKFWSNDDYTQYVDSLNPSDELRAELMKNPWLHAAPWKGNWWQEAFDPEYYASQYYGTIRTNALQWADEMREKFRQQDYNSAKSQVDRNDIAGINSALSGSVSPGQAAENDQPALPSPYNGVSESGFENFERVGSAALKFFQFVVSGAQSLQQMGINADNAVMTELGANTAARQYLINNLATQAKFKAFDIADLDADDANEKLAAAVAEAEYPGFSRRTQRYLKRMGKTYTANSLAVEDLKWQLRANIQENKKRVQSIRSEKGFDEDFQTWINNGVRLFSDIEYNLWQIENKAKREGWKSSYLNSKLDGVKTGAMNDLYDWVNSGGHWYNTVGVLGLPILGQALGSVASGLGGMITKGIPSVSTKFSHKFIHHNLF